MFQGGSCANMRDLFRHEFYLPIVMFREKSVPLNHGYHSFLLMLEHKYEQLFSDDHIQLLKFYALLDSATSSDSKSLVIPKSLKESSEQFEILVNQYGLAPYGTFLARDGNLTDELDNLRIELIKNFQSNPLVNLEDKIKHYKDLAQKRLFEERNSEALLHPKIALLKHPFSNNTQSEGISAIQELLAISGPLAIMISNFKYTSTKHLEIDRSKHAYSNSRASIVGVTTTRTGKVTYILVQMDYMYGTNDIRYIAVNHFFEMTPETYSLKEVEAP